MSNEVLNPHQKFYDNSGNVLENGTLTFNVNLTGTLDTIYSDEALSVTQSNPYTLDATGTMTGNVRFLGKKRMVVKDQAGATVRTLDNVVAAVGGDSVSTIVDTYAALATTPGAVGQIVEIRGHTTAGKGGGKFIGKSGSVTNDYGTQINSATTNVYWQRADTTYLTAYDFGCLVDDSTDDTIAWNRFAAGLPADGGTMNIPAGVMLIQNFKPTKHNLIIQGAGRFATRIRTVTAPSGAAPGLFDLDNISRGRICDLTLDAGGAKNYCLGFCSTSTGLGGGLWQINNVIMYGGINTQVILGNNVSNPDTSSIQFINSSAYGGAFGSVLPSQSQVEVAGSNTLLISWTNGTIGGGQIAKNIIMTGGEFSCHNVQGFNSTSWYVEKSGGQYRSYDEHTEGTGGYLHTLSSDPQGVKSAQDLIFNAQITVTGANTSRVAVLHEAPRQLAIHSTFFNEDINCSNANGRIFVNANVFGVSNTGLRDGRYNNVIGGGQIFGYDVDGGSILCNAKPLRFISNDTAAYIGSSSTYPYSQDVMAYWELTVSSAADTNGPNRNAMVLIIRNVSFGGTAFVTYEQNSTPVITSQVGATFVTGAPGVNEIQIKTRGVGLGISFLAGANLNGNKLSMTYMAAQ